MKNALVLALSFATAVPSLACTIQNANGQYVGAINGGMVTNYSGAPVGSIDGEVIYSAHASPVGRVSTIAVQNAYGQNVGFVQGNAIFNLYGLQRGQGFGCNTAEKGAALLLLLGVN